MPDITPGRTMQFRVDNADSWDDARDATEATQAPQKLGTQERPKIATGAGKYDLYRIAMAWDTSAITVTPASAILKLYGQSTGPNNLRVVKGHQTAAGDFETDYVAGDFDKIVFGTPYSGEFDVSSWTTSGFNEIAFGADALADMAALDSFEIWIVAEADFDDVEPSAATYTGPGWEGVSASEGSSQYPKISYVEGSAGETVVQRIRRFRRKKTRGAKGKGFSTISVDSPTTGGKVVGNGFKTNGF
jgi:hypothetical protein